MSRYLQAYCGGIHFLVDALRVLEVVDRPLAETPDRDRQLFAVRSWRDQPVTCIDMPLLFGLPAVRPQRGIVVESGVDDADLRHLLLAVEGGEQLLSLDAGETLAMAAENAQLSGMFEGVMMHHSLQQCPLVLKFPADWVAQLSSGGEEGAVCQ